MDLKAAMQTVIINDIRIMGKNSGSSGKILVIGAYMCNRLSLLVFSGLHVLQYFEIFAFFYVYVQIM